jgi:hypothetical protein
VFVKAARRYYPICHGLHSKWSYILYCHRGVAANSESHCLRRQCLQSTGMSHVISGRWDEDEPAVSVKAGRKCYPIRRGLHSKRSYVLSYHRGIAADNDSHCRRRRCFRSTSRSYVISTFMKRFSATLALRRQNSPHGFSTFY